MILKDLIIEPTAKTPQIDLNRFTGDLIISGRSIPENAATLYENVMKWVRKDHVQTTEHWKNQEIVKNKIRA